jgi:hypothetical protein
VKACVLRMFGVYTGSSIVYRSCKWYNERSYSMSGVVLKPKAMCDCPLGLEGWNCETG